MSDWTIYHNPRCSKSRETLTLLEEAGVKPAVVEYLKTPPSEETLIFLAGLLGAEALVRTKEAKYEELRFELHDAAIVAEKLHRHPELLERPIVLKGKSAVIGRPPENVKKLLL